MFDELISSALKSVKFTCHSCGEQSSIESIAEGRDKFERAFPVLSTTREVTVYCDNCGAPNTIDLRELI